MVARSKKFENIDIRTLPKEKRPKPTSGQHGEAIELAWDEMNPDEQRVTNKLFTSSQPLSIADMAESGFGRDNPRLRIRNALRRLVRGDWVEHSPKGPATYKMTVNGRRRMHHKEEGSKKKAKKKAA